MGEKWDLLSVGVELSVMVVSFGTNSFEGFIECKESVLLNNLTLK